MTDTFRQAALARLRTPGQRNQRPHRVASKAARQTQQIKQAAQAATTTGSGRR